MRRIVGLLRAIPGFRRMSPDAMTIASAYYGVSVYVLFARWHWGLMLLALPFLAFGLIELNAFGRRRALVMSVVAGAALLAGAAGTLFAVGEPPRPVSAAAVSSAAAASPGASAAPASADTGLFSADAPSACPAPRATHAVPPEPETEGYVAARGSKVFHRPDCASARRIKPENRLRFGTREEAVEAGLEPCKKCKP